jgi:hypothetical protein
VFLTGGLAVVHVVLCRIVPRQMGSGVVILDEGYLEWEGVEKWENGEWRRY